MIDTDNLQLPSVLRGITATTESLELTMTADLLLGSLLRTLVTSKPGGSFLELGTGNGFVTTWLLDGLNPGSTLLSVDRDEENTRVATRFLGDNPQLELRTQDPAQLLTELDAGGEQFELIAADASYGAPALAAAAGLLSLGGLLVASRAGSADTTATAVITQLESDSRLRLTKLDWAAGVVIAARLGD